MEELQKKLQDYLERSKKSQNQVAKSIGLSGGAISAWLNGSYKGDNAKIAHSIKVFLKKEESRQNGLVIPIVKIESFRQIHFAMDVAAEEIDIALICGDAGTGKTTALTAYIEEFGGIYIKADKTTTQHRLIALLSDQLGISTKGPAGVITERIIHCLEDRDTLVVIDEADYLSDGALEYLRQVVYDAGRTGLVLCGLRRLESMIQNVRNDHDQLLSRIGLRLVLEDINTEDMEAVIEAAWPGLNKDIKTALIGASSIRFRSKPSPCLRILEKLLNRLYLYTARTGKDKPTVADVKEVAKLVMRRG